MLLKMNYPGYSIWLPLHLKASMRCRRQMMMGGMTRMMAAAMARIPAPVSTHPGSLVGARGTMAGLSLSVLDTSITSSPVDLKVSLRMSVVFWPEMRS